MTKSFFYLLLTGLFALTYSSCSSSPKSVEIEEISINQDTIEVESIKAFVPANQRLDSYLTLLKDKRVAVVANQTSMIEDVHIVDSLINLGIDIKKVFAPEHGFRGNQDAGAHISDDVDVKTGLPLLSLHGKSKKPSKESLSDVDVILFDIQDVGVRFYTYISTLHYVMEACAENNKKLILLDRPNPHDDYVDGPVLESKYKSFVGMHEVPVVYGMTIGEYGQMINGEKWLTDSVVCDLSVIEMLNYQRGSMDTIEVAPSPNLPNFHSIQLYPSLCLFEGTYFSVGRGTSFPFETYGAPDYKKMEFSFVPVSIPGAAQYPKHENEKCYGVDLSSEPPSKALNWEYIIDAYNNGNKKDFFLKNGFINLLLGTNDMKKWLSEGWTIDQIQASYKSDVDEFLMVRELYLIYNN